jgi:WXG100 family type VII secretion target
MPADPQPSAVESTPISVQLDSLEEVQYWLNDRATIIMDKLQNLASQLDPLEATWSGKAQEYYFGLRQEWNTAAAGLLAPDGVLGEIARAMGIVWNNYSQAEWDNARTWQQG